MGKTDEDREYDRALLKSGLLSLFWGVIQDRRRRGKDTLQEVAHALGRDKSTVSKWFSDPPNWRLETMADVASALDLDLDFTARDRVTGQVYSASGPVAAPAAGTVKFTPGLQVISGQDPSLQVIPLGYNDPERRSA